MRIELVAEGMIGDQYGALVVSYAAQFSELVDSAEVGVQAEDADMSHVGRHFHPTQQQHASVARHLADLGKIPHRVVLRDADRADSDGAGALYQVARRKIRVRAAA